MPFTVPEIRMKVGSRLPLLRIPLLYSDGTPIDLSDATGVTFNMRLREGLINVTLTGDATIYDPPNGMVQFAWGLGDTDTGGCYLWEFRPTWPSSLHMHTPGDTMGVLYLGSALS